jgi:hypothetical protein
MLQVVPSLKEKTERVGGFKSIWDNGELRGDRSYVGRPILYRGHKDLNARIDTLCEQSSPDEVRQTLAVLQSARDLDFLSRAASAPCPTASEIASSFAKEMTLNEPDADTRISMALLLLPYYSDGTRLQSKWIEFGFNILRETDSRTSSSRRSEFENRLIGQVALIDFGRAMSYIDNAEPPLARLRMLIAVVEALDRESMRAKQ